MGSFNLLQVYLTRRVIFQCVYTHIGIYLLQLDLLSSSSIPYCISHQLKLHICDIKSPPFWKSRLACLGKTGNTWLWRYSMILFTNKCCSVIASPKNNLYNFQSQTQILIKYKKWRYDKKGNYWILSSCLFLMDGPRGLSWLRGIRVPFSLDPTSLQTLPLATIEVKPQVSLVLIKPNWNGDFLISGGHFNFRQDGWFGIRRDKFAVLTRGWQLSGVTGKYSVNLPMVLFICSRNWSRYWKC